MGNKQNCYSNSADDRCVYKIGNKEIACGIAKGKAQHCEGYGIKTDVCAEAYVAKASADKSENHCGDFALKNCDCYCNGQEQNGFYSQYFGQKAGST